MTQGAPRRLPRAVPLLCRIHQVHGRSSASRSHSWNSTQRGHAARSGPKVRTGASSRRIIRSAMICSRSSSRQCGADRAASSADRGMAASAPSSTASGSSRGRPRVAPRVPATRTAGSDPAAATRCLAVRSPARRPPAMPSTPARPRATGRRSARSDLPEVGRRTAGPRPSTGSPPRGPGRRPAPTNAADGRRGRAGRGRRSTRSPNDHPSCLEQPLDRLAAHALVLIVATGPA